MANTTTTNPSLGALDRLPAEIRNTIYELVITSPTPETPLLGRCDANTSLAFVPKQVSAEAIGYINQYYGSPYCVRSCSSSAVSPCQHTFFTVTVRKHGLRDKFEEWGQQSNTLRHQFDKPSFTIKFITGHLRKYAPASITVQVNLREPKPQASMIFMGKKQYVKRPRVEISIVGGHRYLNRVLDFEVRRRMGLLPKKMKGNAHRIQAFFESLLLEVAEVLREKCLDGRSIIAETREKVRRYGELRNAALATQEAKQEAAASAWKG